MRSPVFRPAAPKVLRYELPDGWVVLVGRTDADNDALTFRVARPDDRWFHVKGVPGSHVLLPSREGEEPSREVLKAAAAIAAYHSRAREAGVVPVVCALARFVTKPPGAKPGSVEVRKETVLKVRPGLPEAPDA